MKNLIVANERPGSRCSRGDLERMLRAQLDNSLELGWAADDLWIVTNFPFEYSGIPAMEAPLNSHCLTGSKMFALSWLFESGRVTETIWSHDLDCWQNVAFAEPEFADVGACHYSRPKFNGGSVFWRPAAHDIVAVVLEQLRVETARKEEPTLQQVLTDRRYRRRVTILNSTYNVGCSGFVERFQRAEKPVRACHFHPNNRLAWETHVLDRNGLDGSSVSPRLEQLLRRHYPALPRELSPSSLEKVRLRRHQRSDEIGEFATENRSGLEGVPPCNA